MSCVALVTKNGSLSKQSIPIPAPAANQLLVKVSHVAQNPTDSKSNSIFGFHLLIDHQYNLSTAMSSATMLCSAVTLLALSRRLGQE